MSPTAALVGAGAMGRIHLDALRRLSIDVRGVWSSNPERARHAAHEMGVARAYHSYEDLLADDAVDVVHIVTPNSHHFQQAGAALRAGKQVICEKPLTTVSADAASLVELAREHGRVAAVGFTKRHYPWVAHARSLIQQGELGRVRAVRGGYLQAWARTAGPSNWRRSAQLSGPLQVVADLGSHWTDLVRFTTGLEIERVAGRLASFARTGAPGSGASAEGAPDPPGDDYAEVLLELSGAALGAFIVSQVSYGNEDRLWIEIDADDGSVAWTNERPAELRIARRGGPVEVHVSRGQPDPVRDFLAAVYARVVDPEDASGYATFADGLDAVLVGEAILASSRTCGWVAVSSTTANELGR